VLTAMGPRSGTRRDAGYLSATCMLANCAGSNWASCEAIATVTISSPGLAQRGASIYQESTTKPICKFYVPVVIQKKLGARRESTMPYPDFLAGVNQKERFPGRAQVSQVMHRGCRVDFLTGEAHRKRSGHAFFRVQVLT
jgi:hypothetical protein